MRMIVAGIGVLGLVAVATCSLIGWPLATYRDGDFLHFGRAVLDVLL